MNIRNWQFMPWQREIIKFFLPYVKVDRRYLLLISALNIVTIASNTLLIWKIGQAISQITNAQFEQLYRSLIIIGGIVLFNQIIRLIYAYHFQRITLRFIDRVRGELLGKIMQLSFPVNYFFKKGDLIARLSGDVDRLLTFVINLPLNLFTNILVLIVYSSMVVWIDLQLSLVALALTPIFFLSQRFVAPKAGQASRKFTEERSRLLTVEEQTLANLRGISSFTSEDVMREKHRKQFNIARQWALKVRKINVLYNTFSTFLVYFAAVVIVFSGVSSIESGRLDIGALVSFLMYLRNLTNPVRTIARMPIKMHSDRIAADRIMEIMRMQPNVAENYPDTQLESKLGNKKADIEFSDVTFSYPNSQTPIFKSLSAHIHAGESVALVGPSGSGKSTFANLLLRFFDPNNGAITIGGIDIKSVSLSSLRNHISIVWQQPFIINGSIKENLLLAKPQATLEQMESACRASFAREFVEKLENGMDTVIGPSGINLSVGQAQRLAIAQAFLRDSHILVLDEASSALDSQSEKMVVEAIQALRQNRTTLIIAHRFSSIRTADRIFYFDGKGSITSGTHEELMSTHADYQEAVNWQITHE